MKLSILQMPIVIGDFNANQNTLRRMLEAALPQSPDVILLPELWDIGFYPRPLVNYADPAGEKVQTLLSRLAAEYRINIVGGSAACLKNNQVSNTSFVFDRQGMRLAAYSKTHLFSPAKEDKTFAAGEDIALYELDGLPCATIICYDLRFPELCRRLALAGITVLFVPAEWPTARLMHWRTLTQARAIENQFFVAACNGSGAFANGMELAGHSVILDPWGERLAEAGKQEAILTAELIPAVQTTIRNTINVFADRRPDLY